MLFNFNVRTLSQVCQVWRGPHVLELNSYKVEIVPLIERDNYEMKQVIIIDVSHFGLSHDDSRVIGLELFAGERGSRLPAE